MKTLSIKVTKRTNLGKQNSKLLRSQKNVPCVMYGGKENFHFYAHENDFKNLIYTNHVYKVELDIEGSKHLAVLKDIQFHPVSDALYHIDFVEISENKPCVVSLPITLSGTSKGVLAGGKISQKRRYLKVKGLVNDMPEVLDVDITELNIGGTIKVGNLKYDKVELLDPAQALVVAVVSSRVSAKGLTTVVEAEGAAE
ncbi:MAG: 50S ribosomal protein L25/general stress protein Ctc [Bacteroidales bacterium]|nr:50S ribosomal protein L25/general stress protein Ctc [Bacteroidales bacterium]